MIDLNWFLFMFIKRLISFILFAVLLLFCNVFVLAKNKNLGVSTVSKQKLMETEFKFENSSKKDEQNDEIYEKEIEARTYKSFYKSNSNLRNLIKFEKNNSVNSEQVYEINYSLEDSPDLGKLKNVTGVTLNNTIIYKQIYPNIDLKYTVKEEGLLEEFIVADKATALSITQIPESFNTKGVYYVENDDKSIDFFSVYNDKLVFKIPKPVMYEYENTEERNYDLHYQVIQENNLFYIKKIIDHEGRVWLGDIKRIYPIVIDASTISTSTGSLSTAYSFQRKTWFDGIRYWSAFNSATNSRIEFWYSTDGSSWSENTSARISIDSNDFSIQADSSNLFISYSNGYDIETRKASSYPTTGFSWGSATIVFNGSGDSDDYNYSYIEKDSDNKLWITATQTSDSGNYIFKAIQSTNANDISTWQTESSLDTSTNSNKFGIILSLGSSNLYSIWIDSTTIEGKKYSSGTWDVNPTSIGTGSSGLNNSISGTSDENGYVHLAFVDSSGNVIYRRYTDSWQSAVTLDSNAGNEYVSIGIDKKNSNNLYAAWVRNDDIYYRKGNNPYALANWNTAVSLVSSGTNDWLTVNSNDNSHGDIFVLWSEGSSSPYSMNWSFISNTEDANLTFSILAVGINTVTNGITTNVGSTFLTLPFSNLSVNERKYVAHKLVVTTNSESGYEVNMKLINFLQGNNPANDIDPFAADNVSWTTPRAWTSPTGIVANVNTGWIGANTSDTRVDGWSDGAGKFGPVSSVSYPVMKSTEADSGTQVYVTYAIETNINQPEDLYTGTLVYNILPTY